MNNVGIAFILTILAGFSTMIGTFIIFFKKKNDNIIISSLSFASGVMLSVSIFDLIPESFNLLSSIFKITPTILFILIFISLGIILSMLIDKYLPNNIETKNNKNLYRVGIFSMIAIILHNIPEGIATFMATNSDISLGISLALAIALHNIPEGISISVPLYYSSKSRGKALLYTFISGISEPFGALLTFLFLKNFINDIVMGFLFSLIAGIMSQIALYELLPTSLKYKNRGLSYLFFIIGFVFMIITHFIF